MLVVDSGETGRIHDENRSLDGSAVADGLELVDFEGLDDARCAGEDDLAGLVAELPGGLPALGDHHLVGAHVGVDVAGLAIRPRPGLVYSSAGVSSPQSTVKLVAAKATSRRPSGVSTGAGVWVRGPRVSR